MVPMNKNLKNRDNQILQLKLLQGQQELKNNLFKSLTFYYHNKSIIIQIMSGSTLQQLMKPTSNINSPRHQISPRKSTRVIPQLKQLQSEIISKKPNNTVIHCHWANSRLNKITLSSNYYQDYSDDDEEYQAIPIKKIKSTRRNAVCISNQLFLDSLKHVEHIEKLQQTKSMILIRLKNMEMLKQLSDQILWQLVQDFQQKQYEKGKVIIGHKQKITNFYVVVSGQVNCKSGNQYENFKKPTIFIGGCQFGIDSLLFQRPSPNEYVAQQKSKIAHIEGRRITNWVRQVNEEKYKNICRALVNIDFLINLHEDQVDKIAEIGMNQVQNQTEPGQQLDINDYGLSIFIVLKGSFNSYLKKLNEALRNQPNKNYKVGDAFGIQSLKKQKGEYVMVSEQYGTLIEIKCQDIQRVIGPLEKLEKRKLKRK